MFDVDGDGVVTVSELKKVLKRAGRSSNSQIYYFRSNFLLRMKKLLETYIFGIFWWGKLYVEFLYSEKSQNLARVKKYE